MDKNLLLLLPLLPLIGFLLLGLSRQSLSKSASAWLGNATIAGSFVISLFLFFQKSFSSDAVVFFSFIRTADLSLDFAFQYDELTSLFTLIITGVGLLIHIFSSGYMHDESNAHYARYFAFTNLFIFFMLVLVLAANFVILFIGWEGVGLCSYLLIGYWYQNKAYASAANKAFIMNRIGDLAFLTALFVIFSHGSSALSFSSLPQLLTQLSENEITLITLLLFIGATGKSAQIPLFTWLPDAMAGPTPVSALIHAATMVTAGIFLVSRCHVLFSAAYTTQWIMATIGAGTALLGALIALKQFDIKKVLAYSTVSQLGYMFMALGTGAYVAAVFHVITHAFFKALLFLGSGSVIHALHGEQDIRKMGGLQRKIPVTAFTFLIGSLALAGIPPFSGFFSKDTILSSVFEKSMLLWVMGVITAMLTAFYIFRLYFIVFKNDYRGDASKEKSIHEGGLSMNIPLLLLAALALLGGVINLPEITGLHSMDWLDQYLQAWHSGDADHLAEWVTLGTTVMLAGVAILTAWLLYRRYQPSGVTGIEKVMLDKFYVDELYNSLVVQPVLRLSTFFSSVVEPYVLDGWVRGIQRLIVRIGEPLRKLQTGYLSHYLLWMVVALALFFVFQFYV